MMKVRLSRDEVTEALTSIQQVVPPKTTLPILSNLLMKAEGGRLYITATDLDISISTSLEADVLEDGATTVPARKFAEIVREFPQEVFQLDESEDRITLTCGKGQYKLTGMDWEEFPKIQNAIDGVKVSIDGGIVRRIVGSTSFAVSSDETRPALGGVLWKMEGKDTKLVSTDGHRLALIELTSVLKGDEDLSVEVIVPSKALNQINRLIGEGKQLEGITFGEKYLQADLQGAVVITRLVEGPYPNYELVMPKDNDKLVVVDRDVLEAAVRRVAILSNTQTHQVRFDIEENSAMLSAVSPDLGAEAREQVEVSYDGAPLSLAYNAHYFLEVLRHLPKGELELSLKTPVSACLVRPVDQAEGEILTFLLMPLRLND
ncbi:DNA polymerase III subunit beta [Gemmatimonadota bacterium]